MAGTIALLGAALTAPALAANFLYDFDALTTGGLIAQDGWYSPRSYWGNPTIVSSTAPSGTSNMIQETGTGSGGYAAARALPTGTFYSGTETAAVFQYDAQATRFYSGNTMWLGGNGDHQVLGDDWSGAQAKLGPSLGFYNSTAGVYTFRLGTKAASGGWTILSYVSTVPLGDWVSIQLIMDFTANAGAGSGSLFFKDLTTGETSFTAAPGLQNINLGLTVGAGLAAGYTPDKWNQIGFDFAPVNTYPAKLDNLLVSSTIPEPSALPLLALGGLMLGRRRRA